MSDQSKKPNIVITSISDDSGSISSCLSISDLEDDGECDSNSSKVTLEANTKVCGNEVTVEEMIAAATSNFPQHSQINIESSTDISIGHHTIIQGPVIIRSTKHAVADILRNEVIRKEKIDFYNNKNEESPDMVLRSKSSHAKQWLQFINTRKKQFVVLSILLIILLCLCALFPLIGLISSNDKKYNNLIFLL